jgi:hypothetical protein
VEAEVDARAEPGRGEHAVVLAVEDVRLDPDFGEQALQLGGREPVRRRAATVE